MDWSPRPRTGSRRQTTLRRLLRTEDRTKDRFKAINQNSIRPGTTFQGENVFLVTENSVGTLIHLRERLDRGILANKHIISRG